MNHESISRLFCLGKFLLFIFGCQKNRLVGGSAARLGDDTLELVDLRLGTAEGSEPLLRELAGALVLAVAQQLNNAALVGGETVRVCWLGRLRAQGLSTKTIILLTQQPP